MQRSKGLDDANEQFVALLPAVSYALNRILEDSTPRFSKKVGIALWALQASSKADEVGCYLTTSDLVETLMDWMVVSESSAGSMASKLKADLFDLGFVRIEGGRDHIHLTERGAEATREMLEIAGNAIRRTMSAFDAGEQRVLLDFAKRMLSAMQPTRPTRGREQLFADPDRAERRK
jgi:hypothetical protein